MATPGFSSSQYAQSENYNPMHGGGPGGAISNFNEQTGMTHHHPLTGLNED